MAMNEIGKFDKCVPLSDLNIGDIVLFVDVRNQHYMRAHWVIISINVASEHSSQSDTVYNVTF